MVFLPYDVNQSLFELGQSCWLQLKLLEGRTAQFLPPNISVLLRAEPPLGKGPETSMRPGRLHSFVGPHENGTKRPPTLHPIPHQEKEVEAPSRQPPRWWLFPTHI